MSPLCPGCGCLEWIITGPWPNATWLRVPIIRGAVSAAGRVPGVSRVTWPSVEYHLASAWEISTPGHTTHDTEDTENTRCSNCYCYYDCELAAWAGLVWEQQRVIISRSVYYRCCWHCTVLHKCYRGTVGIPASTRLTDEDCYGHIIESSWY